jgi:formate/nitrite transporter FocA (FNT family)
VELELGFSRQSPRFASLCHALCKNTDIDGAAGEIADDDQRSKTLAYAKLGFDGIASAFVKAILCNWMVTLGVVMSFTSQSTIGKIAAMWLPILTFFAQGFEHSVVNMFVIPAGMIVGAPVSFSDWWLWNQIPVTLGNIFGGFVFTGLALYLTHKRAPAIAETKPVSSVVDFGAAVGR